MVATRNSVWDKETMIVLFTVRMHATHHSFETPKNTCSEGIFSCVEDVFAIDILNEQLEGFVLSKMLSRLNSLACWGRRLYGMKLTHCTLDVLVDALPLQCGFDTILNFLP